MISNQSINRDTSTFDNWSIVAKKTELALLIVGASGIAAMAIGFTIIGSNASFHTQGIVLLSTFGAATLPASFMAGLMKGLRKFIDFQKKRLLDSHAEEPFVNKLYEAFRNENHEEIESCRLHLGQMKDAEWANLVIELNKIFSKELEKHDVKLLKFLAHYSFPRFLY